MILRLVRSMRAPLLVVLLMVSAVSVRSDPTPEEEAFLHVPGEARVSAGATETFRVADLPTRVVAILRTYDSTAPNGLLSPEFHGFTLDLNGDGKAEYFFATTYGGSAGPDYLMLTETPTGWTSIGGFVGTLHIMPVTAGWPDLVTTSRGGGGTWAKTHHRFRDGKYVPVSIEHYDRGIVTTEPVLQ
jgi:hypothetical protein